MIDYEDLKYTYFEIESEGFVFHSKILKKIIEEVSDYICEQSYGFEGPGTFFDCGECFTCLCKKFKKEHLE